MGGDRGQDHPLAAEGVLDQVSEAGQDAFALLAGELQVAVEHGVADGLFERNADGRWIYGGIFTEQFVGDLRMDGTLAAMATRAGERDVEAAGGERDEELAAHGIRAAGLKTDEDCAQFGSKVRLKN